MTASRLLLSFVREGCETVAGNRKQTKRQPRSRNPFNVPLKPIRRGELKTQRDQNPCTRSNPMVKVWDPARATASASIVDHLVCVCVCAVRRLFNPFRLETELARQIRALSIRISTIVIIILAPFGLSLKSGLVLGCFVCFLMPEIKMFAPKGWSCWSCSVPSSSLCAGPYYRSAMIFSWFDLYLHCRSRFGLPECSGSPTAVYLVWLLHFHLWVCLCFCFLFSQTPRAIRSSRSVVKF